MYLSEGISRVRMRKNSEGEACYEKADNGGRKRAGGKSTQQKRKAKGIGKALELFGVIKRKDIKCIRIT